MPFNALNKSTTELACTESRLGEPPPQLARTESTGDQELAGANS